MLPNPILINGKCHSRIALYRYADPSSGFPPVILTHGTFSNAVICSELAAFLNAIGLDCWIYEWADHGRGTYGGLYPDAEDRTGKWMGKDGFDYYRAMKHIKIPTLMISGSNDLISPPSGCRKLFLALGCERKKYVPCAKATGYAENYTHPRLIASRNAKAEIWPSILEFIQES